MDTDTSATWEHKYTQESTVIPTNALFSYIIILCSNMFLRVSLLGSSLGVGLKAKIIQSE
jgi:hypothetical protein